MRVLIPFLSILVSDDRGGWRQVSFSRSKDRTGVILSVSCLSEDGPLENTEHLGLTPGSKAEYLILLQKLYDNE